MVKNKLLIRSILAILILVLGGWYLGMGIFGEHIFLGNTGDDLLAVVVANRYIGAFTPVMRNQVTIRNFPKSYIPPGALHAVADLVGDNGLPIFASAVAIPEGQPITRSLLNELGKSHGMASILGPGKVAVAFAVDPVRGVGGWVQPGDTIAIFNGIHENKPTKQWMRSSQMLFSSVRVLAVDHKRVGNASPNAEASECGNDADTGGNVLTVLMNPLEASRLVEARENGHLSIVLRALGDDVPWDVMPGAAHE
jgi:pilus assembly protein CpaB